jgi:hypothetical protein
MSLHVGRGSVGIKRTSFFLLERKFKKISPHKMIPSCGSSFVLKRDRASQLVFVFKI